MTFLFFSDRKRLSEEYTKWLKENNAKDCAFNLVTFLEMNDLLNRKNVVKFLESEGLKVGEKNNENTK